MKIKFITLNIFNGNFLDGCVDFLLKEKPDVFVLQEVFRGGSMAGDRKYKSFEIVKSEFKDYFYFFTPEFFKIIEGTKVDSGNVIFSRLPFSQTTPVYFSHPYRERPKETPEEFLNTPRNLQIATIKFDQISLYILNIHGIWGTDSKDNPERLNMSRKILESIKEKENIILGGDFNVGPDTETIRNLEKKLANLFKDELETTFNMKVKTPFVLKKSFFSEKDLRGFSKAVVDMIFVSPNLKVLEHNQPKVDVSDHYPLIAVFEI